MRAAAMAATSGPRLRKLLRLSIPMPRLADEQVVARTVAPHFGVTPSTVRRWMRTRLPADRVGQLEDLVLPSDVVLEQERVELRRTLRIIDGFRQRAYGAATPPWAARSFMSPHRLVLVKYDELGIVIPRIGAAPASASARQHQLRGIDPTARYARVIRAEWIFATKYHAMRARFELLERMTPWRVQVHVDWIERGATQAWLLEGRTPTIPWMRAHRVRRGRRDSVLDHRHAGDASLTEPEIDVLAKTVPTLFRSGRFRTPRSVASKSAQSQSTPS